MGVATPIIMGTALAAQAVGGAVSAYGTYKAGEANAAAANYQAQVAQNNAAIARDNARYASETGESEAYRLGLVNRARGGAIRAGQAASGVDVNTGSNVAVQGAAAELGQLDALTLRSKTARQVFGYEVEATSDEARAGLLRAEAQQAKQAAKIGAISSLLGTASSVGSKYASWTNTAKA